VDLALRRDAGEQLGQSGGPLQKRQGVGQEMTALIGERAGSARAALFMVQRCAETAFERKQSVAYALFGQMERRGGRAKAALTG
jgi:hypothetical protein